MSDILKTWPAFMSREKVLRIFTHDWNGRFFWFTLSRGQPQRPIAYLWFTHQNEIIGCFHVDEVLCNTGDNIPELRSLENRASGWQIKRDSWVARCEGPFVPLKHSRRRVYYGSFRGFRYFDFREYASTMESRIPL